MCGNVLFGGGVGWIGGVVGWECGWWDGWRWWGGAVMSDYGCRVVVVVRVELVVCGGGGWLLVVCDWR